MSSGVTLSGPQFVAYGLAAFLAGVLFSELVLMWRQRDVWARAPLSRRVGVFLRFTLVAAASGGCLAIVLRG